MRTCVLALGLPLVAVLLVAIGCGDANGGTDTTPTVEEAEEERDEPAGERSAAVQRMLDACKEIARRAPGISQERKDELIAECEEAAASDEEALRRATRAMCDVLAAAAVPWPARGPVAEACKQAIPGASSPGSSPY